MELIKYKQGEVLAHIRHDLRQLPAGKSYGNESVDLSLSHHNTKLIDRGSTAEEVNRYRKSFERSIFQYNRRGLVKAVELVIQCPDDCPIEQRALFFQTVLDWYCDTYLPAGKDCVFLAEIHRDEHKFVETENGTRDISKEHLHIAYVPAIQAGKKHSNYQYRLCADALTKKSVLRELHASLQAELDSKRIQATVYKKKNGDGNGKTIPLSVKQLKAITNQTGIVLDHSLTVDELAGILAKNVELKETLSAKEKTIAAIKEENAKKKTTLSIDPEKVKLKTQLQEKELENQQLKAAAQRILTQKEQQLSAAKEIIAAKDQEISSLQSQNRELQEKLHTVETTFNSKIAELQKEKEKTAVLEEKHTEKEHTWGSHAGWGYSSGWGNNNHTKEHTIEEEKLC